ncbi:DUF1127 domain-containing protein [Vibrio sp. ZSDE26]|uniref:DUF1127 domain-containing protein n=1 Tax=Vibrio amylolyticus TaxID=2847292 RepID=A0A9X1XK89_9VIBR|nr:DUF1127 domain-containing protein [Vibrio amylolyticus]MCK6262450.1 DUF1127 domain-containing protein [Vibrio amylolyticus]
MNRTITTSQPSVNLIKAFFSLIKRWSQRSRSRKQLAELSPHMLADIGLNREQANFESNRRFWN